MLLLLEGAFFYSRMPGLARIFYVGVLEVLSRAEQKSSEHFGQSSVRVRE